MRSIPWDQAPKPDACKHQGEWESLEDDYGSLGSGGSYYRDRCLDCGEVIYSMMPD